MSLTFRAFPPLEINKLEGERAERRGGGEERRRRDYRSRGRLGKSKSQKENVFDGDAGSGDNYETGRRTSWTFHEAHGWNIFC